jgi:hypothetical protein
MAIPNPPTMTTLLLALNLRGVFRPDDPLAVPLLRLMIATDDVRHLQKLLIQAWAGGESPTESDRLIHNGELGHLFRLLCGHLYEAATPFRAVDQAARGRLDEAVADDAQALAALAEVRQAYAPDRREGLRYEFLYVMRNAFAFHYSDEQLRGSYENHAQQGHLQNLLVLAEGAGLSRFTVTDSLLTFALADALGEDLEGFQRVFQERIGEAIRLAGLLAQVVDTVLAHLIERTPHSIEDRREDAVTIPPALRAARDEREARRRAGP